MIKFLKNLVATAPVVVAKKKESLDQFRKIIYASPEEAYNAEENKFVEIATDVIVKTGTDKEESLVDYYLRNWRSVAPMWVRYYRKNLPSGALFLDTQKRNSRHICHNARYHQSCNLSCSILRQKVGREVFESY